MFVRVCVCYVIPQVSLSVWGCYNENTCDKWPKETNISQILGLRSPRLRCWEILCLLRTCVLVYRWPSSASPSHGREMNTGLFNPSWKGTRLPGSSVVKKFLSLQCRTFGFDPWVGNILEEDLATLASIPAGESHG